MFESIQTSIKRRYAGVSKKGLTRASVWINTDEYQGKDYTDECLNQYGRVWKYNIDEYLSNVKHDWVFLTIQTSIKRRNRQYQGKDYTDECLNQYGWVSKDNIDEYQWKDYTDVCLN